MRRDVLDTLNKEDAKLPSSAGGRVHYIALVRPDIQYASKVAMRDVAKPTVLIDAESQTSCTLLGRTASNALGVLLSGLARLHGLLW